MFAVMGKVWPLRGTKRADILVLIDTPRLKEPVRALRRDNQITNVLKTDISLVEQVIDVGGQQQTVISVKLLVIRRDFPRLNMAGTQMIDSLHAGNSTAALQ